MPSARSTMTEHLGTASCRVHVVAVVALIRATTPSPLPGAARMDQPVTQRVGTFALATFQVDDSAFPALVHPDGSVLDGL